MEGWIKLYRKIQNNALWTCEPFTRGQAWIDLLLLANHEYGYFFVRDHKIEVQRGQVGWSENKLSERWKWSRSKVRKFIKDLEKEQQVIQQKSRSYSTIEIINYELYQEKGQQQDNSRTTAGQQQDINKKKEENIKKYKEWRLNSDNESYKYFIDYLLGKNELNEPLNYILKLDGQLTEEKFLSILEIAKKHGTKITHKLMSLEEKLTNKNGKGYKDLSKTLNNWVKYNYTK